MLSTFASKYALLFRTSSATPGLTRASSISVTMMGRFMLNLHRSATDRPHNYSTSSLDFGSVVGTSMVFTSRFATTAGGRTTHGAGAGNGVDTLPPPPWTEEFELAPLEAPQSEEVLEVARV